MSTHVSILLDNYHRHFGTHLVPRGENEEAELMRAPFVVLSHGTQADPIFNYGNLCAQKVFEMDWDTLTSLPSRFSAEPMHRDQRADLLHDVQTKGHSNNYQGIRISSTGQRFLIESAQIWMLFDSKDQPCGQAATFSEWKYI